MSSRKHFVKVSLSDQEVARLDEFRGDEDRAVYMRRLLQAPPDGSEVATHSEALQILSRLARDGKVAAAIALERAVRVDPGSGGADGELARLLRGDD
jgi:hypothetical protein